MNIGIMKIGANITQSSSISTASNFDLFSLTPILEEFGHTVRIFTRITRNTVIKKPLILHDYMKVESLDKLDILLVFNGPINFFGGKEDTGLIRQYQLINKFKGKVVYVMTDCRYPFTQLWNLMILKEWHKKYNKKDIWVTRDDIHYLYQGRDKSKLVDLVNKPRNVWVANDKIHCFPIDYALMMEDKEMIRNYGDRQFDLIYGGSNRDSNRKHRFEHYYLNNDMNTCIFGSIHINGKPNSNGAVPHSHFMKKLSTGMATIIIGDKHYENNFFTLRMYESILAGCLTFIDKRFDEDKLFYKGDELLCDLMYVNSITDVKISMEHIIDCGMVNEMLDRQMWAIDGRYKRAHYKYRLNSELEAICQE